MLNVYWSFFLQFCKLCDEDCPCEPSPSKPNCHMCKVHGSCISILNQTFCIKYGNIKNWESDTQKLYRLPEKEILSFGSYCPCHIPFKVNNYRLSNGWDIKTLVFDVCLQAKFNQ